MVSQLTTKTLVSYLELHYYLWCSTQLCLGMASAELRLKIDDVARAGDLSALQDAIKRGEDVNSVDSVSWFVGMQSCKSVW